MQQPYRMLLGLLVLGTAFSCSDSVSRKLPKAKVSGIVSFEDEPLTSGIVVFQHASGEVMTAEIDSSGAYSANVAQGLNLVLIQSTEPGQPNPDPNGMPKTLPGESHIPDKYGNFTSSGLSFTVESGDNSYDVILTE